MYSWSSLVLEGVSEEMRRLRIYVMGRWYHGWTTGMRKVSEQLAGMAERGRGLQSGGGCTNATSDTQVCRFFSRA